MRELNHLKLQNTLDIFPSISIFAVRIQSMDRDGPIAQLVRATDS